MFLVEIRLILLGLNQIVFFKGLMFLIKLVKVAARTAVHFTVGRISGMKPQGYFSPIGESYQRGYLDMVIIVTTSIT